MEHSSGYEADIAVHSESQVRILALDTNGGPKLFKF
jgi:hypothetical protein